MRQKKHGTLERMPCMSRFEQFFPNRFLLFLVLRRNVLASVGQMTIVLDFACSMLMSQWGTLVYRLIN